MLGLGKTIVGRQLAWQNTLVGFNTTVGDTINTVVHSLIHQLDHVVCAVQSACFKQSVIPDSVHKITADAHKQHRQLATHALDKPLAGLSGKAVTAISNKAKHCRTITYLWPKPSQLPMNLAAVSTAQFGDLIRTPKNPYQYASHPHGDPSFIVMRFRQRCLLPAMKQAPIGITVSALGLPNNTRPEHRVRLMQ